MASTFVVFPDGVTVDLGSGDGEFAVSDADFVPETTCEPLRLTVSPPPLLTGIVLAEPPFFATARGAVAVDLANFDLTTVWLFAAGL